MRTPAHDEPVVRSKRVTLFTATIPTRPLVVTRAAQRTILDASERRVVASDLTGPDSLVRLVDTAAGSTVALLRAEQLDDLEKRHAGVGEHLVLRRSQAALPFGWEVRRLLRSVLRDDDALPVHVAALEPTPWV